MEILGVYIIIIIYTLKVETVAKKTKQTDLESKYDHGNEQCDLYEQDKELSDDLREDDLRDIDACHPRPINESLITLHYQYHRTQSNRDTKCQTGTMKNATKKRLSNAVLNTNCLYTVCINYYAKHTVPHLEMTPGPM